MSDDAICNLNAVLDDVVLTRCLTPAAQLVVRERGEVVFSRSLGWLDEAQQRPVDDETLFDLASVTKLFTITAFLRLVEAGRVGLEQPVCSLLPEFSGLRPVRPYENPLQWGLFVSIGGEGELLPVDAGQTTFKQLLTHTSGLPAWRAFKDQPDVEAARRLALGTTFAYLPDTRIVYSDVGLILLGMALERLTDSSLDEVIAQQVTRPLGLQHTRFLPIGEGRPDNVAPTEFCRWRNRRVVGEVHDESAARLGGVAGHAGLFSVASDVAAFGQLFLMGGGGLLSPQMVAEMCKVHAEFEGTRRGLGFALWSADPEASSNPFSPLAFGHTGFTGTSLWMDPHRQLTVALLTNEVYGGREGRGILELRVAVHRAVVMAFEGRP